MPILQLWTMSPRVMIGRPMLQLWPIVSRWMMTWVRKRHQQLLRRLASSAVVRLGTCTGLLQKPRLQDRFTRHLHLAANSIRTWWNNLLHNRKSTRSSTGRATEGCQNLISSSYHVVSSVCQWTHCFKQLQCDHGSCHVVFCYFGMPGNMQVCFTIELSAGFNGWAKATCASWA